MRMMPDFVGCSAASGEDSATEMIDQILSDWAAEDADGVAAVVSIESESTATSA